MTTLTDTRSFATPDHTQVPWPKVIGLTLVLGVIAVLASPNAPLGGFWRPDPLSPAPTAAQLPLFILLNMAEGLTFGGGISFLLFGFPMLRAISPASERLTRIVHLAIAWSLLNWWPHDSLHIHVGMNLGGLLAIEYGFHVTLMICGAIMAWFFLVLLRGRTNLEL